MAWVAAALSERPATACVQGAPVDESCRVHLVNGPVLAAPHVIGLGGAYQGIAEGLSGYSVNAAAPAVRTPFSHRWFDYDVDASISFLNLLNRISQLEFGGRSRDRIDYRNYFFMTFGASLQLGPWGIGATTDFQIYDIRSTASAAPSPSSPAPAPGAATDDRRLGVLINRTRVLVARQLFDGNLVVGGGIRTLGFDVEAERLDVVAGRLIARGAVGPEIGFLLRPNGKPYRIGVTYRGAVASDNASRHVADLAIPSRMILPWELDLGVALQAGARPLNVPWPDPTDDRRHLERTIAARREERRLRHQLERQMRPLDEAPEERAAFVQDHVRKELRIRELEEEELARLEDDMADERARTFRRLPREYALLTLGMLITGATSDGISLESFLTQEVTRAGAVVTYSPRAGVETEIWENVLKVRAGTYIEPSRFTLVDDWKSFRQHLTVGFDVNVLPWTVFGLFDAGTRWRLTSALDITNNYFNYGLSFGVWR